MGTSVKWRLVITPKVQEAITSLPPDTKRYIRRGLDLIREDPESGKELKDDLAGLRSLRTGRFRIVYRIDRRIITVLVVGVGPRKTIYHSILSDIHAG